jgi:hypothetical protein
MNGYALLADLLVSFHFCYVVFAIGGELVILLGGVCRWRWVRNLPFRITHLCAVALVAVESVAGIPCPLTVWEYRLRQLAGQGSEQQISFIVRIVRSIIFYDFPAWVFVLAYVCFALLVAATFLFIRPVRRRRGGP